MHYSSARGHESGRRLPERDPQPFKLGREGTKRTGAAPHYSPLAESTFSPRETRTKDGSLASPSLSQDYFPDSEVVPSPSLSSHFSALNRRIAFGFLSTMACSAAALSVTVPLVASLAAETPATYLLKLAAILPATLVAIGWGARSLLFSHQKLTEKPTDYAADPRVHKVVDAVAQQHQIEAPQILSAHTEKHIGIIDRFILKDAILYTPKVTSQLTPRELRALFTHEINHADRGWSKLTSVARLAGKYVHTFTMLGVGFSFYYGIAPEHFLSKTAALVGSYLIASAAARVTSFSQLGMLYASRANEEKTDLRAVAQTKDPAAYLTMLEKATQAVREGRTTSAPTMLQSHPPLRTRMQRIAEFFPGQRDY